MRCLTRVVLVLAVVAVAGLEAPAAQPDAAAVASLIDRHIESRLGDEGLRPAEPADDAEFLRRVYLDLHGVVPTYVEADRFQSDHHPEKRARLVDSLLANPRYGECLADVWQGYLTSPLADDRQARADRLRQWLAGQFNTRSWDWIASELLTATGKIEQNPAVTYLIEGRLPRGVADLTDLTSRYFLGVRLNCAQCHDHPTVDWKQQDFWGMAAFFAQVQTPGRAKQVYQLGVVDLRPGIRISEHFPRFATLMQHAAILRGMSTAESDHKLATYHLHTGYQSRGGAVSYPSLGAIVAKELGKRDVALPNFVTIGRGPQEALTAGFLGPDNQPLTVSDPARGLDFVEPAAAPGRFERQMELLRGFDADFHERYRSAAAETHRSATERAVRLMNSQQKQAFDLSREPAAVREAYGPPALAPLAAAPRAGRMAGKTAGGGERPGSFGVMARRLVEAGVPFVEVVMGDGVGWDTHRNNFPRTRALSLECDAAMAALVTDLDDRRLLDSTLVVWMGEFGRSPQCTGGGRNHWSRAWSSVLIGGGMRGGQVVGRTDRDGAEVVDRPISVTDFLATVCTTLGIDYKRKNHPTGVDRPVPIVDTSKEVNLLSELL